jgi:adenylate kinase family enzyme
MIMLGRHVVVYGPASSGKTTLANRIARHTGVPHIELDAIFWEPNWIQKPLEEFRVEVSRLIEEHKEGWVFDGNYSNVRDLILPLADTVVWLQLPFRVVFWRALTRAIGRIISRQPLWGHSYETFRKSFLSRESLLLYIIMNWRRYKRIENSLEEIPHHATIIILRSRREIDGFLAGLSRDEK